MPRGRPSKYKSDYPERLYEHMSQGFPFETFAAKVNVNLTTMFRWINSKKEFEDAKRRGEAQLYYHYMKIGQALMLGKIEKGNVTAWIFTMKNICGWRDQPQMQIGIVNNLNGQGLSQQNNAQKASEAPTFVVEMSKNGKFEQLKPRQIYSEDAVQ